jgi:hypothetical protein
VIVGSFVITTNTLWTGMEALTNLAESIQIRAGGREVIGRLSGPARFASHSASWTAALYPHLPR